MAAQAIRSMVLRGASRFGDVSLKKGAGSCGLTRRLKKEEDYPTTVRPFGIFHIKELLRDIPQEQHSSQLQEPQACRINGIRSSLGYVGRCKGIVGVIAGLAPYR